MTTRRVIISAFLMLCAWVATAAADVTGHIGPSEDATIPIEGALTADKLTLKTKPQPGRTAAFDRCELTVADEKMVGTIQGGDVGKGTIAFVRIKP